MRFTIRVAAIVLVIAALLVPLVGFASDGPCPDDPNVPCVSTTPPFYVVINRGFEDLNRTGSGCQPIILNHPECTDCCGESQACADANYDIESRVCPMLAKKVSWTQENQTEIVYQMCCNCATDPDGEWRFRIRELRRDGTCPVSEQNPGCYEDLPPGTGIDLPVPFIVGGLATIGIGLLAVGVVVRRRTKVA